MSLAQTTFLELASLLFSSPLLSYLLIVHTAAYYYVFWLEYTLRPLLEVSITEVCTLVLLHAHILTFCLCFFCLSTRTPIANSPLNGLSYESAQVSLLFFYWASLHTPLSSHPYPILTFDVSLYFFSLSFAVRVTPNADTSPTSADTAYHAPRHSLVLSESCILISCTMPFYVIPVLRVMYYLSSDLAL